MKVVKKKMKKSLIMLILAATLALLVAAILVINAVIKANTDTTVSEKEPPVVDKELGEDVYNKTAVAYTHVERLNMQWIEISGGENKNSYGFIWDDDYSTHVLYKVNEQGDSEIYLPQILSEFFGNAKYSDFYAVEAADGYNMPKLFYLCSGIGTPYFAEKISIKAQDPAQREKELAIYGLSKEDSPITIRFSYDADGKEETKDDVKSHTLTIGNRLITGQGYYYMVDGRNFVYTNNGKYFSYAFLEYKDYINPLLVAAGLSSDNAFEPYLTTDYKQWKNEIYENDGDLNDDGIMESIPDEVVSDSIVNITGDVYESMPELPDANDPNGIYGYLISENKSVSFDLKRLSASENAKKLADILIGSYVGALNKNLTVTILNYSNAIDFEAVNEPKYTYKISLVEAIVKDGEDITEEGFAVGENNLIKVTYTQAVNGAESDGKIRHGVIDISSSLVPAAAKAALRDAKIGQKIEAPVEFEIAYTKDNAVKFDSTMVITGIIGIKKTDDGAIVDTVADGTTVVFNYYIESGDASKKEIITTTMDIDSTLKGEDKKIADALMGKIVTTNCNIKLNLTTYYEIFASFTSYTVKSIDCFIVKEPVVSFNYVQASKRDPYYGESFYQNTLENEYSLYALNASACEAVVAVLGGLLESATTSMGLQGSRVVDLNITPAKLQAFGLYKNMIYFELPRFITAAGSSSSSGSDVQDYLADLDDYDYLGTLGFNIYISDIVIENGKMKRYIASDLYDVIAEIDEEEFKNFVFLDQTFVDFYARKNLVLTDISNISNLTMEFAMSDFFGIFNSELQHNWMYIYNGKPYNKDDLTEEQLALATLNDFIDVKQSIIGNSTETELSKLLAATGADSMTLWQLYDKGMLEGDSVGTNYFRTFIEMLYYTFYEGSLTEAEQEEHSELVEAKSYLLKMTVSLGEVEGYKYDYVYEFYRISDRRVMVRLYKIDAQTKAMVDDSVSDFYVSTFAFKKLASGYIGLMNKEEVNGDVAYQ